MTREQLKKIHTLEINDPKEYRRLKRLSRRKRKYAYSLIRSSVTGLIAMAILGFLTAIAIIVMASYWAVKLYH